MNTFKLFVMLFAILAMATELQSCRALEQKNCLPEWGIHGIKQPFHTTYTVDVLCRQPIKLFQVVSTSEFHEY